MLAENYPDSGVGSVYLNSFIARLDDLESHTAAT